MANFKVGDEIIVLDSYEYDYLRGMVGKIKELFNGTFAVEFNGWEKGHDCDGACKNKSGWYFMYDEVEEYKSNMIEF